MPFHSVICVQICLETIDSVMGKKRKKRKDEKKKTEKRKKRQRRRGETEKRDTKWRLRKRRRIGRNEKQRSGEWWGGEGGGGCAEARETAATAARGKRDGGSRAPPADKMIKRQISYIIFTLMLPYRNLWEGRDLCGRVYIYTHHRA